MEDTTEHAKTQAPRRGHKQKEGKRMYRARHKARPVPQLGGAAVYLAMMGTALALVLLLGALAFAV